MIKLKQVIALLAHDLPLPPAYRDHALSGDFTGFRDLHIEPDWLLLYQKKDAKDFPEGLLSIELTGTTHADLF